MRTYHTPGVYFEQDAAPPFIAPLRTDIAGLVGIAERGPLHTPVQVETLAQFTNVFGGKLAQSYLAYAVDGFFANGGETCWIVRVAVPEDAQMASLDIVDDLGRRILTVIAGSPGSWGNQVVARWVLRGDQMLSLTLHFADGSEQMIRDPLSAASPAILNLLDLERDTAPSDRIAPLVKLWEPQAVKSSSNSISIRALQGVLAGGSDGLVNLQPGHLSGVGSPPGHPWGLAALEQIKEVAIVAIPDIMPVEHVLPKFNSAPPPDCSILNAPPAWINPPQPDPEFPPGFTPDQVFNIQQALISHCEKIRNRVAILDPAPSLTPAEVIASKASDAFDTAFAALYYPWIRVDDPLLLTDVVRSIPPSGHIAGVYAGTDRRRGVHKPPANAIVEGARDVDFQAGDLIHGELNDEEINVIRPLAGRGIRVLGARTLSRDLLWRYVNVRRLVLMIEAAILSATQWTVFEPNNILLRREVDRVVRAFLEDLFQRGMLDGATSEDAYTVRCDDSTNPREQIDQGRMLCTVGLQPPLPAEFVVVVLGKAWDGTEVVQETGALQNV